MRVLTCFMMLLMPVLVCAQNFAGMDPEQMQAMMEKAEEMQVCMQNIDQSKMRGFEQRGKQMGAEVKALCDAGKREAAVSKAMSFSKEIAADVTIQEMKQCAEIMQGFMPDLLDIAKTFEQGNSEAHICDE
ncbi:MAG: hypothetical protein ACKE51_05885 [Methylococcaceae bacterium]